MTKDSILDGQQVWQSTGGQQLGSIWGHGAYQAPDWSADWLHRESVALLDGYAKGESVAGSGTTYEDLPAETQAALRERLRQEMRTNRYDPATGDLTVSRARAAAIATTGAHYVALYGGDPALAGLREDYAMQEAAVRDPERLEVLTHFFFWTSWACGTERPNASITYTNNWPHEPLIGNQPTAANLLWSLVSILLLLAGIGALIWWRAFRTRDASEEVKVKVPNEDPLGSLTLTPSMRAVGKYLFVVILVFGLQVILGAITAHYTVEGQHFFGLPLAEWLPYSLTRTWHIQTAVFWIATAFLGALPRPGGGRPGAAIPASRRQCALRRPPSRRGRLASG
jgi:nitric oxide reductase subunit B